MKRKFEFEFELLLSNCPDDDDEATPNFEGISWPEAPRPWAKKRKRDLDRAGNYVKLQTQAFFDRTEKPFSCKNCAGTSCFMDGSAPTCSACVASSRDICDKEEPARGPEAHGLLRLRGAQSLRFGAEVRRNKETRRVFETKVG